MPRINRPFEFTEEQKAILTQFAEGQDPAEFWASDLITPIKTLLKNHYKLEQNFTCCYCNQQFRVEHNGTWDAEHIVSKKEYPAFMFIPQNLCISCKDCNNTKSEKNVLVNGHIQRYPRTGNAFLIVHPHFDNWDEHIDYESGRYFPKSEKGSFTITCCGLWRFATGSLGVDRNFGNPTLLELGARIQNLGFGSDETLEYQIVETNGKRIQITIDRAATGRTT